MLDRSHWQQIDCKKPPLRGSARLGRFFCPAEQWNCSAYQRTDQYFRDPYFRLQVYFRYLRSNPVAQAVSAQSCVESRSRSDKSECRSVRVLFMEETLNLSSVTQPITQWCLCQAILSHTCTHTHKHTHTHTHTHTQLARILQEIHVSENGPPTGSSTAASTSHIDRLRPWRASPFSLREDVWAETFPFVLFALICVHISFCKKKKTTSGAKECSHRRAIRKRSHW